MRHLAALLLLLSPACDQQTDRDDSDWDPDLTSGFAADPKCCPSAGKPGACKVLLCINDQVSCPDSYGPEGDIDWCTEEDTDE